MAYPLLKSFSSTVNVADIIKNYSLVTEVQSLLKIGNFYQGKVDGNWGEQTKEAFNDFKKAAYLQYPDSLGKTTATALLELVGDAIHPIPKDSRSAEPRENLKLPGGRVVTISDLILGSLHFTWSEATKSGTRKPVDSYVVTQIIKLAQYLDRVRGFFDGRRIYINSWYRPLEINRAVGGVSNSTHILGSGVDFTVEGVPPLNVYRLLHPWHDRIGGLGKSTQFTHLDLRGYPARWNYGS